MTHPFTDRKPAFFVAERNTAMTFAFPVPSQPAKPLVPVRADPIDDPDTDAICDLFQRYKLANELNLFTQGSRIENLSTTSSLTKRANDIDKIVILFLKSIEDSCDLFEATAFDFTIDVVFGTRNR